MIRAMRIAFAVVAGCTSSPDPISPAVVDISCAIANCSAVDCPDDPAEQCVCYWPPANPITCWGSDRELDRATACADQADLWCRGAGTPSSGCEDWFAARCMPTGPATVMYADEQAACLSAILTTQTPRAEPRECWATWR